MDEDGRKSSPHWSDAVHVETRALSAVGLLAGTLFIGGFGLWAAHAPIAAAAIAPGVVAAVGHNQVVQHLEGGIVRKIVVREGQSVQAGDPLVELDATAAAAQRDRLRNQLSSHLARIERLAAERDGFDSILFSSDVTGLIGSGSVAGLLQEERAEFKARLDLHRNEVAILDQRIGGLEEQERGIGLQMDTAARQLDIVREDLERQRSLLGRGLTNRTDYSVLLRADAELSGVIAVAGSESLSTQLEVQEAREQIRRLSSHRIQSAVAELNEMRASAADIGEQLKAAEDVLARKTVRAPVDGTIVRMAVNSEGGIVQPGEAILDILPTEGDLLVEARVSPIDVSKLVPGQAARLRFSALESRTTEEMDATLAYVSADRLIDPLDNRPYYVARLQMAESLPSALGNGRIIPGTPVEVFFTVGSRTFLSYLLRPVTDSFARAFKEV